MDFYLHGRGTPEQYAALRAEILAQGMVIEGEWASAIIDAEVTPEWVKSLEVSVDAFDVKIRTNKEAAIYSDKGYKFWNEFQPGHGMAYYGYSGKWLKVYLEGAKFPGGLWIAAEDAEPIT